MTGGALALLLALIPAPPDPASPRALVIRIEVRVSLEADRPAGQLAPETEADPDPFADPDEPRPVVPAPEPDRPVVPPPARPDPPAGGPTPLPLGTPVRGRIDFAGERDEYLLTVAEAGTYAVRCDPPMEIGLYAEDGSGKAIDRGFEVAPQQSLKPGKVRVRVMHRSSRGTGDYSVRAERLS